MSKCIDSISPKWIVLLVCLLSGVSGTMAVGNWWHYLGLSVAGGEANTLVSKPSATIQPLAGGEGQVSFHYEARAQRMFIQLGVGANYSLTQLSMSNLIESREAVDIAKESLLYQYCHTSLKEQQQTISAQLMAQVGFLPAEHIYLGLGVKCLFPVTRNYKSVSQMLTTGAYERWAAEYIEDRPQYGYYPLSEYKYSGSVASLKTYVVPTIEVGGNWNIGRTTLRCGIYADYGLHIGDKTSKMITDYSQVNLIPADQTQTNLQQNLRINSLLDSKYIQSFSHLSVGLRFTVLFNVTTFRVPCHCVQ